VLKTKFFELHSSRRKDRCIFNHFYVMRPESYRIWLNNANLGAITPFKAIQGHRVWDQLKLICDFLWVINTNLTPILHRFRGMTFDRSKIAISATPLTFNPPDGVVLLGRSP